MVFRAYEKVKSNKGSAGIDDMSWADLGQDLMPQLYKLWNRLTSGSYFPKPVKEVEIEKQGGGFRTLGIPTILDRIAQEVVKTHLERIVEPIFHEDSYGYRPHKDCHQAVAKARENAMNYDWVIDLDIKSFFDTIDHELMMKAVRYYCTDSWVLMYVERWLKSGAIQKGGHYQDRLTGTPQGGVISPLLANIFLHVVFDKWMKIYHPDKPFERYADDIVVHCKTEKQAQYMLSVIESRIKSCKLSLHPAKTKIVNLRGKSERKYPRSVDFLGFTIKLWWGKTIKGHRTLVTTVISSKSKTRVNEKFRKLKLHKRRTTLEKIAEEINPIIQGVINYYCKFWARHTEYIWYLLNVRIQKWVRWEKGLSSTLAERWLKRKYEEKPRLFNHWELLHP